LFQTCSVISSLVHLFWLEKKSRKEEKPAGKAKNKQTNKQTKQNKTKNKTKQKPGPPLAKGLDPPQVQTDVKGIVVGYC